MAATAQTCRATRKTRAQPFGRSTRFEITVAIWKSNYAICIRDVQKLRLVARRIKRDPERFVETAFYKSLGHVRFTVAVGIAHYLDLIGATLHDKDVAIGRAKEKARITKTAGVEVDPKAGRHTKLRTGWTINNVRPVNRQNI